MRFADDVETNPRSFCSPIKKQKNVTAGVARLVDSDTTYFGTRRADDGHDVSR